MAGRVMRPHQHVTAGIVAVAQEADSVPVGLIPAGVLRKAQRDRRERAALDAGAGTDHNFTLEDARLPV